MKQKFALVIWALLVVGGFAGMTAYSTTAAKTKAHSVAQWPKASPWKLEKNTLVVFLHPRCGCSSATLAELETLIPELGPDVNVLVDFYHPAKEGEAFARGKLFEVATRFKQTEISFDEDARKADLFGARASGEVMFFAANGDLKFHGGLTPLRGHGGDNIGRRSILAIAQGRTPEATTSKTFGCQLKDELATSPVSEVARAQ